MEVHRKISLYLQAQRLGSIYGNSTGSPFHRRGLGQRGVNYWARKRLTPNAKHKAWEKKKTFARMSLVWSLRQGVMPSILLPMTIWHIASHDRETEAHMSPASPVSHLQQASWRLILLHFNSSSLITAWRAVTPPNPLPNAFVHPKAIQSLGHLLRRNYSLDEDKARLDLCYWARYRSPATKGSLPRELKVSVRCEWWISILPAAGALQILNIYEPPGLRWWFLTARGWASRCMCRVEKTHRSVFCMLK